ncbi:DNA-binding response regulator, partial [Streptomyces lavendulae]
MVRIRVLVVDDHRIFAESLAAALAAEPDVDVSAAGSGPAASRCLERAAGPGPPGARRRGAPDHPPPPRPPRPPPPAAG